MKSDKELLKAEEEIKRLLSEIEHALGHGLIILVYNPLESGGEIIPGDSDKIFSFLYGLNIQQAVVIIDGPGGNFNEGIHISNIFRNKLSTYKTVVPLICGSSLCFTVLKSDMLILLKGGIITQIDPCFEYNGKILRAIQHLKDNDPVIKDKAREILRYAEEQILKLIGEKPSLFKHKKHGFGSIEHENIVEGLMNRKEHCDEVESIAFQYIPFKVHFNDDKNLASLSKELIKAIQNYLIDTKRRFCLGCNYETEVFDGITKSTRKGKLLFSP